MIQEPSRPSGTVTFLFTDVEGSTRLWEHEERQMASALERHDMLLRAAIENHDGYVFSTAGDAFAVAFARADQAIATAAEAQTRLAEVVWPTTVSIRVRMGVHTGEAQERGGDYFGPAVNRAARVMSAGHGGQVLVSESTVAVSGRSGLIDLGEHRLKDLGSPAHLYQLDLTAETFPPLKALSVVRNNLPVQRTPILGREADIESVVGLIKEHRLVSLTGVGGVGKTRLALAAAAEAADVFEDGVFFADLTSLSSGEQLPTTVAEAIGLASGAQLEERLFDFLADRHLLVVLDNCEHLIDDVADFVDQVVDTHGQGHFLATSREDLEVDGEQTTRVRSLAIDSDGRVAPAIALLVERAGSAGRLLDPTGRQAAVLHELCERLDGIPLAIELAAAQLAHFTPEDLLARLDDRFDLLSGGRRRRRQRQQTLQAVMDWSWDLLDPPEQALLARLGVFSGRWTLHEAEGVCSTPGGSPVAVTLAALVAKSLAQLEEDGRYRLLETIRLYAQQKLIDRGEADDFRSRHLGWYVDNVGLRGLGPRMLDLQFVAEYNRRFDNIRAAIDWALVSHDHAAATSLIVAGAAQSFVPTTPLDPAEFIGLINRLLDVVENPATRSLLLTARGWHAWSLGDFALARASGEEALTPAREVGDPFPLLTALAFSTFSLTDEMQWRQRLEEARTLAAAQPSPLLARFVEAIMDGMHYPWADAARLAREVPARLSTFSGPYNFHIMDLATLYSAALVVGDLALARQATDQNSDFYQSVGLEPTSWQHNHLALLALLGGDTDEARAELSVARQMNRNTGRQQPSDMAIVPALDAAQDGRLRDCAVILAGLRHGPDRGFFGSGEVLYHYRRLRDRVRRELTVSELEEADDLGRTLTVDAILDEYLGRDPD